jgi:hypothetical protein
MVLLAREITAHLVAEYGSDEVLRRLSDPYWFQAFGCVLGFDWHSSGVTTTVTGAMKEALRGREHEFGVYAGGGKGAVSRRTPSEIASYCDRLSIDPAPLVYASRMSAKFDSAAVQDGYQLYHHAFFFTPASAWCVVQQGMNGDNHMARRYHWLSPAVTSFVNEPHAAVCADTRVPTFNLVAEESEAVRARSAELAREKPGVVLSAIRDVPLLSMPKRHAVLLSDVNPQHLERVLLKTYEAGPRDFESLLGLEGVGARTIRALALVSEVIYGTPASTRDPARFSFALGGKDGTPFPVDRDAYDKTIDVLHAAVNRANIDRSERVKALKRLVAYGKAKVEERVRRSAEAPADDDSKQRENV